MEPEIALPPKSRKGLVIKLALLAVAGAVAVVLVLRGVDLRGWIEVSLEFVRSAGPVAFFAGMAVLPAFGFPLSPFTLSAGSLFAPTLGMPLVLAATGLALAINVTLTYVVTRWLARPLLAKLVLRLGYKWPQVKPADYWNVTVLVRVTPGPPFFLQSALLGLAEVPLRIYLLVSVPVAAAFGSAFVVFGDALLHGKGSMAFFGVLAIVALMFGARLARQHFARKKAAMQAAAKSGDV